MTTPTCRRHVPRCDCCGAPVDEVQTHPVGYGEEYHGQACTDEAACRTRHADLIAAFAEGTHTDPPCTCLTTGEAPY